MALLELLKISSALSKNVLISGMMIIKVSVITKKQMRSEGRPKGQKYGFKKYHLLMRN